MMELLSKYVEFKNGKKRPTLKGTIPVYGGNGILDYTNTANMQSGVVIGRVGVYCGSVFLVSEECWVSDNAIKAMCKENIDLGYLYYLLSSLHLNERRIGTSQPLLTQNILNNIEVEIPELAIQKKISSILELLDEKIKLNNEINKNLEEQAQSIFANEFLSLDTLPEGWKQASLIDIADYLNGLAMQKYRPTADESGIPVLKIKELRQGCCDDNSELCSPSIKSDYIIHDGDVIFSWSGSLLVDFWCGGTCGLNQHLFKVTSNIYDKWFYYSWTNYYLQKFAAIAADMATTMGHIKREELAKSRVLIPSNSDYERIGGLLAPLYNLVISNRIENSKLATIRDTLLPKLMSGEVDVSNLDL